MESDVTNHVWSIEEIVALLDSHTKEPAMDEIVMTAFALGMLAVKGLVTFAIVYAGARLAIRHERRVLSN